MVLTIKDIEKYKGVPEGIKKFLKEASNGLEIIDLFSVISANDASWLKLYIGFNEEENKAFEKAYGITNSKQVIGSRDIDNSYFVLGSFDVKDSKHIFSSGTITSSEDISGSSDVENSSQVFDSYYVYNSSQVINSKNITRSRNIIDSNFIIDSNNIIESSICSNSNGIVSSSNLDNCLFCTHCADLKNSLFCSNFKDGEYYIFNKPMPSKDYFEIIKKQYEKYAAINFSFVNEWPVGMTSDAAPVVRKDIRTFYNNFSIKFWDWVKSLPNYDPEVLYLTTFLVK